MTGASANGTRAYRSASTSGLTRASMMRAISGKSPESPSGPANMWTASASSTLIGNGVSIPPIPPPASPGASLPVTRPAAGRLDRPRAARRHKSTHLPDSPRPSRIRADGEVLPFGRFRVLAHVTGLYILRGSPLAPAWGSIPQPSVPHVPAYQLRQPRSRWP